MKIFYSALAFFILLLLCSVIGFELAEREPKHKPKFEIKRFVSVDIITLDDGTRCAVLHGANGGIDCEWGAK